MLQDIRQVVEEIENFFATGGGLDIAGVRDIQQRLLTCIEVVNNRLRACDELLRRGLRQEAIQECEQAPHLLDLVTELDFPHWDAWADYVRTVGVAPQTRLLTEVASELNEAYAQAQPLEELLTAQRLHALARSPLSVRLEILRNISERDPTNRVWREDIGAYERERVGQIPNEMKAAVATENVERLRELKDELTDKRWSTPLASELVQQVVQAHNAILARRAVERLRELEPVIAEAFSEFDVGKASAAREEWQRLAKVANLRPDSELARQVVSAFEWLDEERAEGERIQGFHDALAALEIALDDDGTKRSTLERLMAVVVRFDEPLPERILRRYRERLYTLDVVDRRRGRFVLVTSLATIVVIVGMTGGYVWWYVRQSQIQSATAAIRQLLDDGRYEEAQTLMDDFRDEKPYIVATPSVQGLEEELSAALANEASRRSRFGDHLARARSLIAEPTWDTVVLARRELAEADSIASNENERLQIATVRGDVDSADYQVRSEIDKEFRGLCAELRGKLEDLESLPMPRLEELLGEAKLLASRARVSVDVRQGEQIDLVVRRLTDRIGYLNDQYRRDDALNQIVGSIGKPLSFEQSLERYVSLVTPGARAADFKFVLSNDVPLLENVREWNELARRWRSLSRQEPPDPKAAIEVITALESKYTEFPGADELATHKPYFTSLAARADGHSFVENLKSDVWLTSPVFLMNYAERKQDSSPGDSRTNRLFFVAEPRVANGRATFRAVTDSLDLSQTTEEGLLTQRLVANEDGGFVFPTPQKEAAERALRILNDDSDLPYELLVCQVLDCFYQEDRIDPILRCWLLQEMFDAAASGSSIVAEELADFRDAIRTQDDLSAVNWLAVDAVTDTRRQSVQARLTQVKESGKAPANYYQVLQERYESETKPLFLPELRWVGIFLKDGRGRWECVRATGSTTDGDGRLICLPNAERALLPIGELSEGAFRLDEPGSYREGTPVFLVEQREQSVGSLP